jgi:hypothetical protein
MRRFLYVLRCRLREPFQIYCSRIMRKLHRREPVSTPEIYLFKLCSRVEFSMRPRLR